MNVGHGHFGPEAWYCSIAVVTELASNPAITLIAYTGCPNSFAAGEDYIRIVCVRGTIFDDVSLNRIQSIRCNTCGLWVIVD